MLRNEIEDELMHNERIGFDYLNQLNPEEINAEILHQTRNYIRKVNRFYIKIYNRASDKRDDIIRSYQKTPENKEKFIELKRTHHNDRLSEFVENSNEPVRIVEYKGRLIQKIDPIYLDPESNLIKAHFYAPRKKFLGIYYKTFWVNAIVIWLMALFFYIILYYRGLRKLLDAFENLNNRFVNKE